MKKLLLLGLSAATAMSISARTLSAEEALSRAASSSTARHNAPAMTAPKLVAEGEYKGVPSYYIFSSDKAAMILSASSLQVPVIGYLDHPVTAETPIPAQLQWWLNKFGKSAVKAEAANPASFFIGGSNFSPINVYGMKLNMPGKLQTPTVSANRKDVPALLKTQWSQEAPYSNDCPSGTVTGCVATSTSQVMNYFQYPECGTGTVSVTYNKRTLSLNLSKQNFDWANMLDTYPNASSGTAEQKAAVAYLMKAVGYSVDMSYGEVSGAISQKISPALVQNFKYDPALDSYTRVHYTDDQWTDMLYTELAAGRPVIYGGSGEGGGHSFVCDGYQASNGYFHFNWGWNGYYDGFFSINDLKPEGQGTGGNGTDFNSDQDAIMGIQKPVAGHKRPSGWIAIHGGVLQGAASGRTLTFSVSNDGNFFNLSGVNATFDVGYQLKSAAGQVNTYTILENTYLAVGSGWSKMQAALPSSVANGTYEVTMVYRAEGMTSWEPMKLPLEWPVTTTMTVDGNTVTFENPTAPDVPGNKDNWTYADAKTTTGFAAGQEFDLTITITNNGTEQETRQLGAVIINDNSEILSSVDNIFQTITLAAGASGTYTFKGVIDSDVVAGQYYIILMDSDYNGYIAYKVNVESDVKPSTVEVTGLTVTPATLNIGEDFVATLKAKNPGETETIPVDVFLCVEDGEYLNAIALCGSSDITFTGKMAFAKSYKINCKLPSKVIINETETALEEGNYILAAVNGSNILKYIEVTVQKGAGVTDITVDADTEQGILYDLQGRPVSGTEPGLYIRRSGTKATKVLVK